MRLGRHLSGNGAQHQSGDDGAVARAEDDVIGAQLLGLLHDSIGRIAALDRLDLAVGHASLLGDPDGLFEDLVDLSFLALIADGPPRAPMATFTVMKTRDAALLFANWAAKVAAMRECSDPSVAHRMTLGMPAPFNL
jgi:hypothetical protein